MQSYFLKMPMTKNNNGEIFLNITEKEGWVQLMEKDKDYRKAVIKAFSSSAYQNN